VVGKLFCLKRLVAWSSSQAPGGCGDTATCGGASFLGSLVFLGGHWGRGTVLGVGTAFLFFGKVRALTERIVGSFAGRRLGGVAGFGRRYGVPARRGAGKNLDIAVACAFFLEVPARALGVGGPGKGGRAFVYCLLQGLLFDV